MAGCGETGSWMGASQLEGTELSGSSTGEDSVELGHREGTGESTAGAASRDLKASSDAGGQ